MPLIVFTAFAVVLQLAGLHSYRNQVAANMNKPEPARRLVAVVSEDAALKRAGIRLPGYNESSGPGEGIALSSF